jgi:hypothetical protein
MADDPRTGPCPLCGKERGYTMSARDDLPGLMGILRGESGEAWRLGVTIVVCLFVVLILRGLELIVTHH